MPSQFESTALAEFRRSFLTPFGETVIRRIGGQDNRTEDVEAIVELDEDNGGHRSNANGEQTEYAGKLELAADQECSSADSWVIRGKVYRQFGESTGSDVGSQTVNITRRKGRIAAQPKVRTQ